MRHFVSAMLIAASDSNAWYHDPLLHDICWSVGHVLCIHCCIDLLPLILLSSALLLADVEDQALSVCNVPRACAALPMWQASGLIGKWLKLLADAVGLPETYALKLALLNQLTASARVPCMGCALLQWLK